MTKKVFCSSTISLIQGEIGLCDLHCSYVYHMFNSAYSINTCNVPAKATDSTRNLSLIPVIMKIVAAQFGGFDNNSIGHTPD